jgi:stage II sporulation protein E
MSTGTSFLKAAFSLEALPLNVLAFLIGRATVLQTISPFGLALFAAVLVLCPRRAIGIGATAAIGILSAGALDAGLEFIGAAVGLTVLLAAFDRPGKTRSAVTLAALAFTVTVIAGATKAFLLDATPYRFLMAFFSGLLTFILTLVYMSALPPLLSPARRPVAYSAEQLIATAIAVTTALAGLSGLGYGTLRLSGVIGGLIILVAASTSGGGIGAAVGTVAGAVSALCGAGGVSSVGLAALSGLLAGSFRDFGKLGPAAGYFFGTLLLSPLVEEPLYLQAVVLESALAAALFLLVPARLLEPVREALGSAAALGSPSAPAGDATRERVGERLIDFSLVFGQLASTLRELSATAPGPVTSGVVAGAEETSAEGGRGLETRNLAEAAGRVCQACRLFRTCWKGDFERVYASMSNLLEVTGERGQLEARDVPPQLRRRCVHLGELVTTLNFLHEIAALNRHWRRKLDDSRGVVQQQLDGLAQILRGLGEGLKSEAAGDALAAEDLADRLDRAGFPVRDVVAASVPDGEPQFLVTADACSNGQACRTLALPVATSFTGRTVAVTDVHCGLAAGRDDCSFRLEAPRQMDFKMGVAQARKSSSGISGDSYLIRELPGNRLAAVLSDGTGAGPRAAEESRMTIRMLEELLRLGFDNEMAVRTINSMVLLRSSHERFATLDLLTADLYGGQARFVKIGAPPSYIRRGREVSVIQSPNLPLGVLPEVATDGSFVTLRPGDLVVMATDGLLAAAGERPVALGPEDGWLVSFLRDAGEAGPQEIADALIEAAVSLGSRSLAAVAGGGPGFGSYRGLRDDVTVVALRFGPPEGS